MMKDKRDQHAARSDLTNLSYLLNDIIYIVYISFLVECL